MERLAARLEEFISYNLFFQLYTDFIKKPTSKELSKLLNQYLDSSKEIWKAKIARKNLFVGLASIIIARAVFDAGQDIEEVFTEILQNCYPALLENS